jgi:ferric-dicitrate binding protein FerR (iron transport regulator)
MTSNDKLEDLLKQMYAQEDETIDTSDIIDEEWQKFEARHFAPKRRSWSWMQIAAAFIGLLMLSGITYAAIHLVSSSRSQQAVENQGDRSLDSVQNHGPVPLILTDSIPQTRIFENAPLDEMITEIAQYYNKVADIESEEAHKLRLYYKWEPKDALEDVVADLNHFDHVSLAIEDDKLIVKP